MKSPQIRPRPRSSKKTLTLAGGAMTVENLTAIMAERVMRWRVLPERFMTGGRAWLPRWRFQPLHRTEHALQLLEKTSGTFSLTKAADGCFTARVSVDGRTGQATSNSKAACISGAIARAIGIDVPDHLLEACEG